MKKANSLPPQLNRRRLPVRQIGSGIIRRRIRVPLVLRQPYKMRALRMESPITLQQLTYVRRHIIKVSEDGEAAEVEVDGHIGGEDVVEEVEAALVEGDAEGVEDLLDRDGFDDILGGEWAC